MAKRKILIVDDHVIVARELETRLAALGYEATAITSTKSDAVAVAAKTEPDLVLMDLTARADKQELHVAEELRRLWRIPVVFMASDEAWLQRAGVTEMYGYVVKPFTDRELSVNIELALLKHDAAKDSRELEDRFFAVSIDMLCFLDFNGYFKRLNPAWERTLGFTRKELMSRPFIEFVHPDDRERTLTQNSQVRGGRHALAFENRYLCKDGSYRWFLWNAAADSPEKVIYSVARDITEHKLAEEEREELVLELQAALAEVKSLREILPICSYCKKIRDDDDYWQTVESYISRHTKTRFSHGICPACMESVVEPQIEAFENT